MAITYLSGQRIQGVLGENKVANFDGTGDYVTVDSLFSGTDAWSFSIWVYHTGGTSGNDGIIGAGSGSGSEQLFYQGSSQKLGITMGTASATYSSSTIAESTWYHIAGTRASGGSVVFYINGVSVGTDTDSGSTPTGTWRIGYTAGSEYWQGSLAEYAVWDDRELTEAEVQAIYNSGSPTKLSDVTLNVSGTNYTTDLIGYYPMGTNFNNAYSAGGGTNGVVTGDATANNSSPTSPISATNDKTSVTDVPAGSEFEQTDDYKNYQISIGDGSAQNTNIFNLTYSTEKEATITAGNDPTGKCVVTHGGSNPESKAWTTELTSGSTKTFEIKFTIARGGSDTANNWGMFIGSDVWDDNPASGTNKRIVLRYVNGSRVDFMLDSGGSTSSEDNDLTLQGTSTTKYYTITGNGTTAKCEYWSTSARSGSADDSTANLSFPTDWLTEDAIDSITFGAWGGGGNAIDVTFNEVSIKWDSGNTTTWVERGTAI